MTFTNEYEYLIHLLSSALHGTVPEDAPENISFEKVFEYGVTHEVANIAFLAVKKLKTLPDERIFDRWRKEYWKAVKRDTTQSKARDEILSALHSHGIYTLEVQGTVVKKYYPQSHLRMMSDLDIIIPRDKLAEAEEIMQSIGYQTEYTYDKTELHSVKDILYIELHTEFFSDDANTTVYNVLNNPFSSATLNEDYTATVTDTIFYLFHWLHTIKHATEFMGVGIRRIIDLYYLENALKDKADFSYIDSILKDNELYEIKADLLAVKEHWFSGSTPKSDVLVLEKEIFESGNHGTEEIFYRHKFKDEQEKGKNFVKFRFFLAFIFPPKEDIYGAYPFCKEHNYPIALCWIHRWIFSAFNKKKYKSVKRLFKRLKIKMK